MNRKMFTAEDPALPMNYPGFVFRTLREDGHDSEALLAGTGLTGEHLGDPNFRCGFQTLSRFLKNAIEVTSDPHLGPKLALRFEPSYVGVPAYTAMNAASFQDGLEVLSRFLFLTFPAIEFTFLGIETETEPGEVAIRLRPRLDFGDLTCFVLSSALVVCEGLCKAMLRTTRVGSRAQMTISEPEGWVAAAPHVGFPVRFEARETRLFFPRKLLARPLPGADPMNHPRLLALLEHFAAKAGFETTLDSQVVAFLEAKQNLSAPLAEVAAALGYSERGLRRQLERSGTSYRKLVDQVRESEAREMLANTSRPIQTIAHELGFEAPSNFARSFKRWTGATPTAFRDSRKARGDAGRN